MSILDTLRFIYCATPLKEVTEKTAEIAKQSFDEAKERYGNATIRCESLSDEQLVRKMKTTTIFSEKLAYAQEIKNRGLDLHDF